MATGKRAVPLQERENEGFSQYSMQVCDILCDKPHGGLMFVSKFSFGWGVITAGLN